MWGPQNSRCFPGDVNTFIDNGTSHRFGAGGSRVIRVVGIGLHMTDFNPSAVARGIGKVVREPTTFPETTYHFTQDVTTSVEVVNNRPFDTSLEDIVLDEEEILVSTRVKPEIDQLVDVEIIDM